MKPKKSFGRVMMYVILVAYAAVTLYADLEKEVRDAAVDLAMLKYEVLERVAATVGNIQTHKL